MGFEMLGVPSRIWSKTEKSFSVRFLIFLIFMCLVCNFFRADCD